jgi:hypothetical protein
LWARGGGSIPIFSQLPRNTGGLPWDVLRESPLPLFSEGGFFIYGKAGVGIPNPSINRGILFKNPLLGFCRCFWKGLRVVIMAEDFGRNRI